MSTQTLEPQDEVSCSETPWLAVDMVCEQYGLQFNSAKHAIAEGRFPVPTYKVGRRLVIDKVVHREYFNAKRESGLLALKNNQTL